MKPQSPVLILGSNSDIGKALAHAYGEAGCDLILAARSPSEEDCSDIAIRHGVTAKAVRFDVLDDAPDDFFAGLGEKPGTVILVAGLLGDQTQSQANDAAARLVLDTNYSGPARYLLSAARHMRGVDEGCIIGISSVAGERGRASNFIYGSAKAGLTAFLSGLRNEFAGKGLHVMTVKPGFVDTQMTEGMDLPAPLTAKPEQVASAVLKAHRKGRDVIYVLGRWRLIMAIIRAIPEGIFKRLSL